MGDAGKNDEEATQKQGHKYEWSTDVMEYIEHEEPHVIFHHRVLIVSGSTIKKERDGETTKYFTAATKPEIDENDRSIVTDLRRSDEKQKKILLEAAKKELKENRTR